MPWGGAKLRHPLLALMPLNPALLASLHDDTH